MRKKLKAGKDVIIHKTVIVKRPGLVTIGNHVAIDPYVYITTAIEIGDYVHIGPFVSVIGGVKARLVMEDFTTIAAGCRLICASDDFAGGTGIIGPVVPKKFQSELKVDPIVMEKHSALGTSVIVFPGITIGEGAVVGAGSVVTKSLKPWTVNLGRPTRVIKKRPKRTILRFERQLYNSKKKTQACHSGANSVLQKNDRI